MIYVMVTMEVEEGRMEEFLRLCGRLRPLVLAERGCLGYDYVRETSSPLPIQEPVDRNRITLVERWESVEALEAHRGAPHMAEFGPQMNRLRSKVTARVGESVF